MRVDPLLPRAEKLVPVLEAIGDDKVRINSTSLDNPLVVLANEALEVVAIEEQLEGSEGAAGGVGVTCTRIIGSCMSLLQRPCALELRRIAEGVLGRRSVCPRRCRAGQLFRVLSFVTLVTSDFQKARASPGLLCFQR
jgi:hypothetical protein